MTPKEMFELIEDLCNKYGIDEVKKTINFILQSLRDWQNEGGENKMKKYFVVVESYYVNWITADTEEEAKKIALENFFNVEPEIYIEDEEE